MRHSARILSVKAVSGPSKNGNFGRLLGSGLRSYRPPQSLTTPRVYLSNPSLPTFKSSQICSHPPASIRLHRSPAVLCLCSPLQRFYLSHSAISTATRDCVRSWCGKNKSRGCWWWRGKCGQPYDSEGVAGTHLSVVSVIILVLPVSSSHISRKSDAVVIFILAFCSFSLSFRHICTNVYI